MLPFLPHEMMRFHDREHAGRVLASRIASLVRGPCVVAGIARGGVEVAAPIARELDSPLLPLFGRKLCAPVQPDLAFGAIDDDGRVLLDEYRVRQLHLERQELEHIRVATQEAIRHRRAEYHAPAFDDAAHDRTVVLVDDGAATGLTVRSTLAYVSRHGPADVLVAVPCASLFAAEQLEQEAEQFVVITVDAEFRAVAAYYDRFDPVTDSRVRNLLDSARLQNGFSESLDPVASG